MKLKVRPAAAVFLVLVGIVMLSLCPAASAEKQLHEAEGETCCCSVSCAGWDRLAQSLTGCIC